MNTRLQAILCSVGLGLSATAAAFAQAQAPAGPAGTDAIVFQAMTDELQRSVRQLALEKYGPPFFLAYQLADARTLTIKATLGELRQVDHDPIRAHNIRLMVGDYALNDENFVGSRQGFFFGGSGGGSLPVPLENDYLALRRAFWIVTDRSYKTALERFQQKLTALKQQNKSESEQLDDYSRITPTQRMVPGAKVTFDQPRWERVAQEVSSVFRAYDQVMSSTVYLFLVDASLYLASNEGTRVKVPVQLACLWVNVFTQAQDGEPLTDALAYYAPTPDQLPSVDQMKRDARGLAEFIAALRQAPVLTEAYAGPVLFEGQAVAEVIAQKLFDDDGLIAYREPVYAVENPGRSSNLNRLDARVNQRICSSKLTIKAVPKLKTSQGVPLVGSFEVDAEGVVPRDELVLVEKGFLRTLLNDRVPTLKVKESNGHARPAMSQGGYFTTQKAPGVIEVSYADGQPLASFRKTVLREAAENGFETIYVVRKLQTQNPGMNREMYAAVGRSSALAQPVAIYRVQVKTGEEQLMRSAVFSEFPITNFKRITQGCSEPLVYNTVMSRGGTEVPVSLIVPQGLVFDDVSIEKGKITKPKLRLVPNPVVATK